MKPKYPHITVRMIGEDGNSFAVIGRVTREMRRHDVPADQIDAFRKEAMSGDYDNLLATVMRWVEVE